MGLARPLLGTTPVAARRKGEFLLPVALPAPAALPLTPLNLTGSAAALQASGCGPRAAVREGEDAAEVVRVVKSAASRVLFQRRSPPGCPESRLTPTSDEACSPHSSQFSRDPSREASALLPPALAAAFEMLPPGPAEAESLLGGTACGIGVHSGSP